MRTILFINLLITLTASASWYCPPTAREYTTKPASIAGVSNPTLYEIQKFTEPSGSVTIAGTRQIIWDGSTATETYQTETQAEADARIALENAPSESLITSAWVFRAILQSHFGIGAETNENVTAASVQAYFVNRRLSGTGASTDGQDLIILLEGFKQITEFTGDETIWSFPWEYVPEELPL